MKTRTTITDVEIVKLEKEWAELKEKIVTQTKIIETETIHVTETEHEYIVLTNTVKTFTKHIKKVDDITEILEKKVKETKIALKPAPAGGKGKKKEDEKDEDGDDKIDDSTTEDYAPSAVAG